MRCEVVAIGTELLLGQIVDTNPSWIGGQLALADIDSHFQTEVGGNLQRIVSVIRVALGRSDAVIPCGGLVPNPGCIDQSGAIVSRYNRIPFRYMISIGTFTMIESTYNAVAEVAM